MIAGPCTDLLRDVLKKEIKPKDLSNKVEEWMKMNPCNRKKLSKSEHELIFPHPSKHYQGDYSDLEISLLYFILRNICHISLNSSCWGREPDPGDWSVLSNIERIRSLRNKYCHRPTTSLSDYDFLQECWQIHSVAVELENHLGIRNHDYSEAINYLKTCRLELGMVCFFNLPDLKAQVSYSDRSLSVVRLSVNFNIFDFFSRTTVPILTRLAQMTLRGR
jgi:hypothetical protein